MPKITKRGPSYDENDPRHVPAQRDDEQTPDEAEETEPSVIEEAPDYGAWTKADLNAELDRREIEHNDRANNLVLIELLEASDAGELND